MGSIKSTGTTLVLPCRRDSTVHGYGSNLGTPKHEIINMLLLTTTNHKTHPSKNTNNAFNRFWSLNLGYPIPSSPSSSGTAPRSCWGRVLFWYCTVGAGFVRLRLSIRFTLAEWWKPNFRVSHFGVENDDPPVCFEVAMGAYFFTTNPALWISTAWLAICGPWKCLSCRPNCQSPWDSSQHFQSTAPEAELQWFTTKCHPKTQNFGTLGKSSLQIHGFRSFMNFHFWGSQKMRICVPAAPFGTSMGWRSWFLLRDRSWRSKIDGSEGFPQGGVSTTKKGPWHGSNSSKVLKQMAEFLLGKSAWQHIYTIYICVYNNI